MKTFFKTLIDNLIFLFKVLLGAAILVGFGRFFNSDAWHNSAARVANQIPIVDHVKTAVYVAGAFFLLTWGIRFFDKAIYKEQLQARYGLKPQASSLGRILTFPLVHHDDVHLQNNTWPLLLFTAIAVLVASDWNAFLLATAVMLFTHGIGVWLFGHKNAIHMGVSGLALAYYSFDIAYGLIAPSWRTIIAILLLIRYGRQTYLMLRFPGENTSVAGHLWGFVSGILATAVLQQLNLLHLP